MSRAFYLNLAVDNLKKSARTIIPYILTSVLTTMMLYMVVSLANNPNLNEMLGAMTLTQMLGFGVVIIEIFAFIFLFYTHSFLIKRRQKEFALFSILGMEKKHLARVLFFFINFKKVTDMDVNNKYVPTMTSTTATIKT